MFWAANEVRRSCLIARQLSLSLPILIRPFEIMTAPFGEQVGLDRLLAKIEHYHRKFPRVSHWTPAPLLRRLVGSKQAINLLAKL